MGEPVFNLYCDPNVADEHASRLGRTIHLSETPVETPALIVDRTDATTSHETHSKDD